MRSLFWLVESLLFLCAILCIVRWRLQLHSPVLRWLTCNLARSSSASRRYLFTLARSRFWWFLLFSLRAERAITRISRGAFRGQELLSRSSRLLLSRVSSEAAACWSGPNRPCPN